MKKTALSLIAVFAIAASVSLQAEELESRSASWDAGQKTFAKGAKSYAGRIKDGTYINGMWSGVALKYAISDPKTEDSPTDFKGLKIFPLSYSSKGQWGGAGFFLNKGRWSSPVMRKDKLQQFKNHMKKNRWGSAVVFTNVFDKKIKVTIDGSYKVSQNESWKAKWLDSWILKVDSKNAVKVLFENHRPVSIHKSKRKPTEIELDDLIEVTLNPGERIFLAMAGRDGKGGASSIVFWLLDGGLKWDVTVQ